MILTEQNKTDDAIKVFTELTEDYPELPEPYNNLAVLYATQGEYDKARKALEMAIRTHPSYAIAHENLGDIYATLASQAYDKALQLDSEQRHRPQEARADQGAGAGQARRDRWPRRNRPRRRQPAKPAREAERGRTPSERRSPRPSKPAEPAKPAADRSAPAAEKPAAGADADGRGA